jgi:2-methylcitrate dehydratase PrpD
MEMDDLHRESVFHPGSVVIPAVLAIAERDHLSGRNMLAAIAVGYEFGIRIALGVGTSHYRHWHTTATCGTFGAAAGAAKALGLDTDGFVWALGSAGAQSAGLWEFLVESAMSKPLHIGKAAYNGLLSALLAQKGFTGAGRILEGEKGFFQATSSDWDEGRCLSGLGQEFLFEQTSLKLHASCGHTHAAVDAALRATGGKTLGVREIDRVEVYVYQAALDLLENVRPDTPTQAKFNLPFCVATALTQGHASLTDFTSARLEDPEMRDLMARVHLKSDPELTQWYPRRWASRVDMKRQDGRWVQGVCEYPRGDPQNPMNDDEVVGKFRSLSESVLGPRRAQRLVSRVLDLDHVEDVADLLDLGGSGNDPQG